MNEDHEGRWHALKRLEREYERGEHDPPRKPTKLPLTAISEEPLVFQHREDCPLSRFGLDMHVDELVRAIKREPARRLDPVTIWQCGNRWIVLDGHFRLEAYSRYIAETKDKAGAFKVPCKVFLGDAQQAWDFSVLANKKAVEPLTSTERSNAAWQRVCMSWDGSKWTFSKKELAGLGLVAENSISRMRRALGELKENHSVNLEEAYGMSWCDVLDLLNGTIVPEGEWDDDGEAAQRFRQSIADRLRRTFGTLPMLSPILFFEGLELYSSKMTSEIEEYIRDEESPEEF